MIARLRILTLWKKAGHKLSAEMRESLDQARNTKKTRKKIARVNQRQQGDCVIAVDWSDAEKEHARKNEIDILGNTQAAIDWRMSFGKRNFAKG